MTGNMKTKIFHHSTFKNSLALVGEKERQGLRISLAFPTLNEEATIGKEVRLLKKAMMMDVPLLDEIVVIDSGSKDNTLAVAEENGAEVHLASDILPELTKLKGKGENLWKSLHVLKGDIILWIDADIKNIHPKFVYGLIGPLLTDPSIEFVKAFYERPIASDGKLANEGGGRVTEILVRPMLSAFFPELACMIQPCAGEVAARRNLLEKLPFPTGYGVETGLIIDVLMKRGLSVFAQVNLDKRIHRNQPVQALGKMGFEILHAIMERLKKYRGVELNGNLSDEFLRATLEGESLELIKETVLTAERPPIVTIPAYGKELIKAGA